MDTNKMRDTYEAWAIQDAASVGRNLVIDREGDWYIGKDAQFLNLGWASWQASREAVMVEIPTFSEAACKGTSHLLRDFRNAIQAQGLKVKP